MNNKDICNYLFNGYENFWGIKLFMELLDNSTDFRNAIISAINDKSIEGISLEELNKFKEIYPAWDLGYSLYEGIMTGNNIGRSALCSYAASYIYEKPSSCCGSNKFISKKDYPEENNHYWINTDNMNIDLSLLIKFPDNILEELGYKLKDKISFETDILYNYNKNNYEDNSNK